MTEQQVLITGENSKLPQEIAAMLDPAVPLPADVIFIEKRFARSEMMIHLFMAIGFSCAALIVIPFGIAALFNREPTTVSSHINFFPLGFGLVVALGAWMLFNSLAASLRLRGVQNRGLCTRRGTFLTSTTLIHASESDTTIIPRDQFRGLQGNSVKYHHNNLEKSFRLPRELIGSTPQQLQLAITEWATQKID